MRARGSEPDLSADAPGMEGRGGEGRGGEGGGRGGGREVRRECIDVLMNKVSKLSITDAYVGPVFSNSGSAA